MHTIFLLSMEWLALVVFLTLANFSNKASASCRCMPSDTCWPTVQEWSRFNVSLGGKLIATVPLASPCHVPHYDASTCQYLQKNWNIPSLQWGKENQTSHDLTNNNAQAMSHHLPSQQLQLQTKLVMHSHPPQDLAHSGKWWSTLSTQRQRSTFPKPSSLPKRRIFGWSSVILGMSTLWILSVDARSLSKHWTDRGACQ